jgi:hypothetical protein
MNYIWLFLYLTFSRFVVSDLSLLHEKLSKTSLSAALPPSVSTKNSDRQYCMSEDDLDFLYDPQDTSYVMRLDIPDLGLKVASREVTLKELKFDFLFRRIG